MAGEWRKNRRRRKIGKTDREGEREEKKERERESQRVRQSEGQRAGTQEKRFDRKRGVSDQWWRKGGKHTGSVPSAQLG